MCEQTWVSCGIELATFLLYFVHSEAGVTGGGDMKDIDDIYDMENYDSDDSPGEYVIAGVHHEHEVCMAWYLLHQSLRALCPSVKDNKCHLSQ